MGLPTMASSKVRDPGSTHEKEWGPEKGKVGLCKKTFPCMVCRTFWSVGREDPRRMIHALKVGLSLTLVSLLYLLEPLFHGVGQNAIWAVMTVVVVLEFTVGATLCKGLNRGLGTIMAGSLAFFIEFVTNESNHIFRAIFIASAVFLIGTAATYVRFIPYIKKNYDYGVVIFLLTFNLITVSSYRVHSVLRIAQQRLFTIGIGCAICLIMSLFVFPNWSGEDLHNSTVSKLEFLARSIEGCVNEYFSDTNSEKRDDKWSDDPIYKAVLDSKSSDETLALYGSWEPRKSRYCKFPWKQYVKVGAALRHFGYTVVALQGCLHTEIQTPKAVRALFKDPCIRLSAEVSQALTELANSIRNRRLCSPSILSDHLHQALQDLDTALKSQPRLFLNTDNQPNHAPPPHPKNLLALAAIKNPSTPTTTSNNNNNNNNNGNVAITRIKTTTNNNNNNKNPSTTTTTTTTSNDTNNNNKNPTTNTTTTTTTTDNNDNNNNDKNPPATINTTTTTNNNNNVAMTRIKTNNNTNNASNVAITRIKTDSSALLEWRNKREDKEGGGGGGERRMLRPQLSKIAITSLEFAEALPFAAFASLLVETVARLDLVIEEVEELGRVAHFKEFRLGDEVIVNCGDQKRPIEDGLENHLPSHGF